MTDAADAGESEHVGTDASSAPNHADGSDHPLGSELGAEGAETPEAHPVASEQQPPKPDSPNDHGVDQDREPHAHPSQEETSSVDAAKQDLHTAPADDKFATPHEDASNAKDMTERDADSHAAATPATQDAPAINAPESHTGDVADPEAPSKPTDEPSSAQALTEPAAPSSAPEHDDHLVVEPPPRQASRSPLPVETDTMHGHEDLFDDEDESSSAEVESDNVKQSTIDYYPDEHDGGPPTAKLSPGNNNLQSLETELGGDYDEGYENNATPTVAQFGHQLGQPQDAHSSKQATEEQLKIPISRPSRKQPRTPGTPNGGLADSVHAPSNSNNRNSYPSSREQAVVTPTPDEDDDDAAFVMPRDVTNVPWHARNESVPESVRSYSTIDDSVASSPCTRPCWPTATSRSGAGAHEEFDPFRYDVTASGKPTPPAPTSWAAGVNGGGGGGKAVSILIDPQLRLGRQRPRELPMFAKLRSMFEGQQQQSAPTSSELGGSGSSTSSPARSRATSSTIFQPTPRDRSSSLRKSLNAADLFNMNNSSSSSSIYERVAQEDDEVERMHEKSSLWRTIRITA
ncbi:hypothetical protein PG994_013353 [Apiospora phragmitis]|uniref:Uncharacterized protein n=1 Tax=Apiospora phragmitis TaxID=2905665 RepID=A0ABR1T8E6_9PEZI